MATKERNMAGAVENWLEEVIYSDEIHGHTYDEVKEMIDELEKIGISPLPMVAAFRQALEIEFKENRTKENWS